MEALLIVLLILVFVVLVVAMIFLALIYNLANAIIKPLIWLFKI